MIKCFLNIIYDEYKDFKKANAFFGEDFKK
jgi:hypothetical protein